MADLIKILIVGKPSENLVQILPQYGYEVSFVQNQQDLSLLFDSKTYYDVIIVGCLLLSESFEILKFIKSSAQYSKIPIIIISQDEENEVYALKLGADNYLTKPLRIPIFLAKIEALVRRSKTLWSKEKFNNVTNNKNNVFNSLTEREKDVLLLVVQGASNQEIAEKLVLSEVTVKGHLNKIFKKFKVKNRTQAMLLALKMNIEEKF